MRTSSYVVYIDLPEDRQQWLIMHGYFGTYDRVSANVIRFLKSKETRPVSKPLYGVWEEDPVETDDGSDLPAATVELLSRRGYLTARSHEEEVAFFSSYVNRLHERRLERAQTM